MSGAQPSSSGHHPGALRGWTPASKLSVYFGERSRVRGRLVADELMDLYGRRQTQLSLLMRGAQGFGAKHRLRTDRLLTLSEDLPLVAVAVDLHERVRMLLDDLAALPGQGLVTVETARMLIAGQAGLPVHEHGEPAADDAPSAGDDAPSARRDVQPSVPLPRPCEALKLSVYIGRHERVGRRPAFAAACQLLYERKVAGASVLLAVDGTRHGQRERARFFARNEHVPMMVLAVGDGTEIKAAVTELEHMLPRAMFTLEQVRVCKRDGELLQAPHGDEQVEEHATPVLQKLTVVTSEAARHEGRPVHLELVRRLRATRLAGATSLRGMWGFHGDHPPHGDRLLSLRRHVPVITTVIDSPERIAQAFPLVDRLTAERGLVTSELVPANIPIVRGCSSVG